MTRMAIPLLGWVGARELRTAATKAAGGRCACRARALVRSHEPLCVVCCVGVRGEEKEKEREREREGERE